MSTMTLLLILWAGLTTILVVLLIYKSTLSMHEDDQLFLSEAETQMAQEQHELQARMNKIQPFVKGLGAASIALLLVIGVLFVKDVWNNF